MGSFRKVVVGLSGLALTLGSGAVNQAQAQPAEAVRIDDGYTWFSLVDNPRFGSAPKNEGWHPVASLRAIGPFASGDMFKLVLRQGKKILGRAQCKPTNSYGSSLEGCGNESADWIGGEPMLTMTGEILVDVFHVNGQTDAEALLRTYKIKVDNVTRVNEGNFTPMPPLFVLNADGRVLDAILVSRPGKDGNPGELTLKTVVATTDTAASLSKVGNSLRCSVDGTPISFAQDQLGGKIGWYSSADGSSKPRSGNVRVAQPRDWRQLSWQLPIEFGPGAHADATKLQDHPGTWICEIRGNGQTLRAFRFVVKDGAVLPHPEQAQGLSLSPTDNLVEYWTPTPAAAKDAPLVAAALKAGGFYGHAWVSPAARDNAANPTKAPAFASKGAASVTTGAASTSAAAGPAPVRYDDGYTWFELENTIEPVNGSPTNLGWRIKANVRAYGTAPQRSAFRYVIKQNGKTVGEARCEAKADGLNFVDYIESNECGHRDREQVGSMKNLATGTVQIEVHFVDGATSADSLLRTHTVQVFAATGIRGNGAPDAPNYYISHNGEVLASLLETTTRTSLLPGGGSSQGLAEITFQVSPKENSITALSELGNALRCRVNDKPVTLTNPQIKATMAKSTAVEHTRADPASSANPLREMVRYQRYELQLPLHVGKADDGDDLGMMSHPGKWSCDWRVKNQTLRTFAWTVGADGAVVPHAEQANGLSLAPDVYLIETTIPKDTAHDQRVDPAAAKAGGFYGRAWTSAEMKAAAAAVPTVGTATPPQPKGKPAKRGR